MCTCNSYLSFALQTDLSHAAFICKSECRLLFESVVSTSCPQSSLVSLTCTSQLCLSYAALSCTSQLGLSKALNLITSHMQLACAPLIRAPPLQFLVAPLSGASPLHWSSVPLICISSAPLRLTSHVQLAFAPHILLIVSLIAPLTCTSDLHLLQHLSIANLSCTYHVCHAASHLGYKSQLHFSVSSLIWTSQFLLLIARLGCTSYLQILRTFAPLMCIV